jgi:hypothetical protein
MKVGVKGGLRVQTSFELNDWEPQRIDSRDIAETSKMSFRDIQESRETKQRRYLKGLWELGDAATDQEVKQQLKLVDPNEVRPRRYECEKLGYICRGAERICRVTGKTVLTFYLTSLGLELLNGGI